MRLFRLCRQKYAELTGYGAKRTGGRWNRRGISALYTAEHASLTVVEVLVHLDRTEIPSDFVLLEITVADEHIFTLPTAESSEEFLLRVYQTGAEALPPNTVGFSVPSIVVPQDRVVVLYSDAPLYTTAVEATAIAPFVLDSRLFTSPAKR